MPSAFAHAAVAVAVGSAYPRSRLSPRMWLLGAACSAAPDLDSLAFRFGIPYSHTFGHRGFFHSLTFALVLSVAAGGIASRIAGGRSRALWLTSYLLLVTGLHGVLDMFTDGGLGIAILSPFSNERFFAPFRPIAVSPISPRAFFTSRGLHVVTSELLWIGVPCAVLAAVAYLVRKRSARPVRV